MAEDARAGPQPASTQTATNTPMLGPAGPETQAQIATKGHSPKAMEVVLLISVFVIASCGLLYELAAGAVASYVLGDSILQFSTIIGTYLFAMGIGSWVTRYIDRDLPAYFIHVELLIGLIGGAMPALLFAVNAYAPGAFRGVLYASVGAVGILVGFEIPLVMRILRRHIELKNLLSQVLSFDYLGALFVSLAFPLLLMPHLGLIRTGLLFGLMNVLVAIWALALFRHRIVFWQAYSVWACAIATCFVLGFWHADRLTSWTEDRLYVDRVVYAESTAYQRIAVTHGASGHRLFLNGNLQFAERDEYRYHEALVHPAMLAHGAPRHVAVLGGGDGMAVREVLKHPSVESITLVELDPNMTRLFADTPALAQLNRNALKHPKLRIVNQDAFLFLEQQKKAFDVIVVDFPDPSNYALGKLYTQSFYSLLDQSLASSGFAVVQSTSPLVARESFWTVVNTIESTGLRTAPYHVNVPSFGEWGFVLAGRRLRVTPKDAMVVGDTALAPEGFSNAWPQDLQFLNAQILPTLFHFPADMTRLKTPINRLSNQVLVNTFEREWSR